MNMRKFTLSTCTILVGLFLMSGYSIECINEIANNLSSKDRQHHLAEGDSPVKECENENEKTEKIEKDFEEKFAEVIKQIFRFHSFYKVSFIDRPLSYSEYIHEIFIPPQILFFNFYFLIF